jgi:hypothetical protein
MRFTASILVLLILHLGAAAIAGEAKAPPAPDANAKVAEAEKKSEKAPAQPTPEQAVKIKKLIARLDADEFTEREAASTALNEFGAVAEIPLREAFARETSPEARMRLTRLLSSVEALKCDLTGEWEESMENIGHKNYYRLTTGPAGELRMAVTDYSEYQEFTIDTIRIKDGKLMLHATYMPGYEFDLDLKIIDKDKLTGTGKRRSDGLTLKVDYARVTKRPDKK